MELFCHTCDESIDIDDYNFSCNDSTKNLICKDCQIVMIDCCENCYITENIDTFINEYGDSSVLCMKCAFTIPIKSMCKKPIQKSNKK